ncbi:hypothetical protein G6F65_022059 [Rhizopus arrhizus]|nr:hypothetical protein G6F31_014297 [Rhizopus arrhizus]KAG1243997.1 hypothetical protein G6F65_022059 [Rhizopus arrhizus]
MVVVLGEHDARPASHAQRRQHHLLVVGRSVDMDDVKAPGLDQAAQLRAVLEPGGRARRVLHVDHGHTRNGASVAVQPAGGGRRHGDLVIAGQGLRQVDDVGDVSPAVAGVEVRVQDLHFCFSARNISLE